MLGCFKQNLGQIWTNPNVGLKMQLKQCTVESESLRNFEITFLTQHLGLSIFYPNLGSNNPALFRVYKIIRRHILTYPMHMMAPEGAS